MRDEIVRIDEYSKYGLITHVGSHLYLCKVLTELQVESAYMKVLTARGAVEVMNYPTEEY